MAISLDYFETALNAHNRSNFELDTPNARRIYVCESKYLYQTPKQSLSYLEATLSSAYFERLVKPFRKQLENTISKHISSDHSDVSLIDLGPGIPLNSIPIIEHLSGVSSRFSYIPIDISSTFLNITVSCLEGWGFEIIPIQAEFEGVGKLIPDRIWAGDSKRVVNLGLTFNNFEAQKIISILSGLTQKGDSVIITFEVKSNDISENLAAYKTQEAAAFNYASISELIHLNPYSNYVVEFLNDRVEMGFVLDQELRLSDQARLVPGDKVITSVSHRYDRKSILEYLRREFSTVSVPSNIDETLVIVYLEK